MSASLAWIAPVVPTDGVLAIAGETIPTPDLRQSAISLLAIGADNVSRLDVDAMTWGINSTGRITLRRTAVFDIAATAGCQTRLGLSGAYTGASSYVGAVPAPGLILPLGLRLDGPLWDSEGYRPANVSGASSGAVLRGASGTLLIDTNWANAYALETVVRGVVYDVAHAGRWAGRGRVMECTRQRQGRRSNIVTLALSMQGVS